FDRIFSCLEIEVSISDLYSKSNASENSKLDVETDGGKKYIARDNGKGTVYFKVNGLESGMDVYVGGTKVTASSGVYKADYSADANAIIITVKKGSSTIISETYNMIRPTLDSILLYDDDNERKADEVTKFSSNFAATYTFDEDWEDLYILPIPSNAKYVETLEVEGDELDVDDEEWYDFALKKDTYEIEIDITVEVGSDKASQTYTLYVSNEDYEGGSIKEFIANDDDNSKSPFLSFVGKEKIYVFVPYDSEGDDIYFQALTGNDEDQISYDGSDAVDGDDDDEWYEAEKLEKITIEDEYGFTTTYEVVIYTADDDDLENDTELKDLALSTGKKTSSIKNDVDLTPEFDEDVKAYTAAVEDEDQIYGKISLKLADKNAYVFINDEFVGTGSSKAMTATIGIDPATTNKYEIVVVAEDCETDDTYTLTINGGNSTALKALTISGLSKAMSPAFNATQLNYIGYTSAATATITATAESSACSVTIAGAGSKTGSGSATGTFNLAQGLNVFTITNYQKGMDSNVYSVSIYRVPDVKTIKVSKQNVTVNGASKTLTAYNINGNNFLQLRDVALLLSGTSKGFGVSFNDSTQSAYLTTGSTYVANGTENAAISNYTRAALSTQKFYLNNTAINPAAFNIDGSNYVMLRDLGVLLNFGITYSNNTIAINTNTNYVPGK
ncbi:MAG: cadherin-like beta sandwich domain-containing protein, partial [Bacillota bacterium]|nr:cadherin-like beta sandwich domain-containing protein [Bacillota bacterium]